jgi:hypothetical protein
MTDTHRDFALKNIQRVVTIASSPNPPITLAEALEQIVETLELAGFAPLSSEDGEAFDGERLH